MRAWASIGCKRSLFGRPATFYDQV